MSRLRIEFQDATQDNILDRIVPSDLRLLIGERDRAEAEAQALREEVAAANDRADTLEHRMMGMMTRHFAEAWRTRDTEKALDGYLSAGIAELERERDAALAEVAALRARVVVPDAGSQRLLVSELVSLAAGLACRRPLSRMSELCDEQSRVTSARLRGYIDEAGDSLAYYAVDIRRIADELARLNAKSISAETLRRIDLVLAALRSHDFHGIIASTIGDNWREEVDAMRCELRELLDEGKES